jgi:hypothetical protein
MDERTKPKHDMDEPVKIDLDPEVALRALLKVDPDAEPFKPEQVEEPGLRGSHGDQLYENWSDQS